MQEEHGFLVIIYKPREEREHKQKEAVCKFADRFRKNSIYIAPEPVMTTLMVQ